MKGLTATERCFAWKIQQDMLPVGNRIHRKNAERRCLTELENNQICIEVQTLQHCFASCPMVQNVYEALRFVLTDFLERSVSFDEIIHFSFNQRNKKKFAVKVMFKIFHDKSLNKTQILRSIIKEIEWNLHMNIKLGSSGHALKLKESIETCLV